MIARLLHLGRRFGPTMLLTLTSQGVSAAALFSIVLLGITTSDAYALGIQVGTSAFSGVILQVLYFIAIGRPWMRSWRTWSVLSAAFSLVFAAAVIAVTAVTSGIAAQTAQIVGIFGLGGVFLALGGVVAVRQACAGKPLLMVSLTIFPNVGLALASLVVRLTGATDAGGIYAPAIVWAIASVGVWLFCLRFPRVEPQQHPEGGDSVRTQRIHATTLSIGLIGGTIYPTLLIAALATLPAGTTTILFLISRIGTTLVSLLVSSVLTVRFNWNSEVISTARVATVITSAALASGAVGLALHATDLEFESYVLTGISWVGALIAAPLVLREMHARRMVFATSVKTFVDLALMLTVGTWFLTSPSISGFFGIYILQQAVSLATAGFALRKRWLATTSMILLVVSLAQVFLAW